ncbi:MAG: hypothetical protein H5U29_00275 [Pusillimonas sp.]|nr:hypothetical protein [Pusillimonas sp.]
MHWSDRYIGQPYIPESGDCAAFAERVAREVLRINPKLPESHASGLREQAEQISQLKDSYAVRVDAPIDGQPVLFVARGRFFHIGVAALIGGETWIVHADQSAGAVVCQRLTDMTRWAYKLEGAYRWI